jgi:hypothetical protein
MTLFRHWKSLAIAAAAWLTCAATLLAQKKDAAAASGDKAGWALSYLLVILLVALGLMAVCRPGSRAKEIKRDVEEA